MVMEAINNPKTKDQAESHLSQAQNIVNRYDIKLADLRYGSSLPYNYITQ